MIPPETQRTNRHQRVSCAAVFVFLALEVIAAVVLCYAVGRGWV